MESANLNCLRSIAVLCVFVCHSIDFTSGKTSWSDNIGHTGVMLFFVHTSLVLMMSLERQSPENRWSNFMVRRLFRIYPLAILAVLVYFLVGIPAMWSGYVPADTKTLFCNLALVQNLFHVSSIPRALWSLPYELQMYLLLPMIFVVIRGKNKLDLVSIWLVSAAASILAAALLPSAVAVFAQYVPCFMAGAICYGIKPSRRISSFLFPVLIVSLVIVYGSISHSGTAIPFWPGCLLLGVSIPLFREIESPIVTKLFAFIAKYSFGIYLWHDLVLWFVARPFGFVGVVVSFVLTLALAWISYRLIEDPLIQIGKRISSRKQNSQNRPLLEPSLS